MGLIDFCLELGPTASLLGSTASTLSQMQRFRLERKQVRTPTEGLRSAGLAFKSEDEVISYPVRGRARPPEIVTGEVEAFPEAWTEPVKKRKKRRERQRPMFPSVSRLFGTSFLHFPPCFRHFGPFGGLSEPFFGRFRLREGFRRVP